MQKSVATWSVSNSDDDFFFWRNSSPDLWVEFPDDVFTRNAADLGLEWLSRRLMKYRKEICYCIWLHIISRPYRAGSIASLCWLQNTEELLRILNDDTEAEQAFSLYLCSINKATLPRGVRDCRCRDAHLKRQGGELNPLLHLMQEWLLPCFHALTLTGGRSPIPPHLKLLQPAIFPVAYQWKSCTSRIS